MTNFNERIAEIADTVRAMPEGKDAARALMRLADDVDGYLMSQKQRMYAQRADVLQKWGEYTNSVTEDAGRYHEEQLVIERRKLARAIASDPRWTGGYADALALLTEAPPAGA